MKKRIMAAVLSTVLAMSALAGCGAAPAAPAAAPAEEAKEEAAEEAPAAEAEEKTEEAAAPAAGGTINLWSFTDEVPGMVDKYIAEHPDFGFDVNTTIIATTEGAYQPALDQALQAGGAEAPDMY